MASNGTPTKSLACVISFLNEIGLQVTIKDGACGFVRGIEICKGAILVDSNANASELLHEAGHLAVIPEDFRRHVSGNLSAGVKKMLEYADQNFHPQSKAAEVILYCSDTEATAWAWAAGKALGFDEAEIIRDEDYSGQGESIRLMLGMGRYMGIHGLSHGGWCVSSTRMQQIKNLPLYPNLRWWLMPASTTFSSKPEERT